MIATKKEILSFVAAQGVVSEFVKHIIGALLPFPCAASCFRRLNPLQRTSTCELVPSAQSRRKRRLELIRGHAGLLMQLIRESRAGRVLDDK